MSAKEAVRIFGRKLGIRLVAWGGDIEITAVEKGVHFLANVSITETADVIEFRAKKELELGGGSSYSVLNKAGIKHNTAGEFVVHSAGTSMEGPQSLPVVDLPASKEEMNEMFVLKDKKGNPVANYGNDVDDLGLRFVDDSAFRVFHLVALDEYRENFSDTTIESARTADSTFHGIRAAMGFELGIPGAHSDVGGGYTTDFGKPITEERKLPPARTLNMGDGQSTDLPGPQEFVYAHGWYTPNDQNPTRWLPWQHTRKVTGDYYKVALSLMVDMAERFSTAQYRTKLDMNAREAAIAPLQPSLRAFVASNAFAPARPSRMNWELDSELGQQAAKEIRHKHLHLSFNLDATGMGPRYKNINTLERHHEPG
ncbi:DUF2345 domain-containing protein [Rhodoferax sp. GW822-FHT02A01]|uniref:DUF2345 domain-containing protein n=1 Tax=Rhodoferax sp. GW822-FHT02A01 TaxID=3141537 RepID=UPI00315D1D2E